MLQNVKSEQGLTLVELLATVAILGVVVALFITLSGDTLNANKQSDYTTNATTLAEQTINKIRNDLSENYLANKNAPIPEKPISGVSPDLSLDTYISKNRDSTSGIYNIHVQYDKLASTINYVSSKVLAHHVSLQSIVLIKYLDTTTNTYKLRADIITVIVSWGNS